MIRKYFYTKWKSILSFLFILFTYLFISFLYSELTDPILYTTLILLVLFSFFFFVDYYSFCKTYKELKKLENSVSTITYYLKEPASEIEKEYVYLLSLIQKQFIEYKNEMDIKNRERNDYFTLWAHQIKTPISAMHLLLDDSDSKDLKEQLFLIEEDVTNAMGYLRADSSVNDFVFKKCNIEDICKSCIRHYSSLFIKKKLALSFSDFHYEVLTDEKWLAFVINQILSNALKYTNTGSISIYMQENTLVIEDTGIGIQESDLPRIFEKNFTGENGHHLSTSSGMGLYLCKIILDKLSHRISITSSFKQGTKVSIAFAPYNTVRNT